MFAMDALRDYVDKPITIHCGFEVRESGFHNGFAVDFHIVGLSLLDQFLAVQRFSSFRGLGLYTWWNSPGIHADTRPMGAHEPRSLWGSVGPKKYVPVTKEFLYGAL